MRSSPLGRPSSPAEHKAAKKKADALRALRLALSPNQQPVHERIPPGGGEVMARPTEGCLTAVAEILESCRDVLARVDRLLAGPGPTAQVSAYALAFGRLLVWAMGLDCIFVTDIWGLLRDLDPPWRRRLGLVRPDGKALSYRQVHHRLRRLVGAFSGGEPVEDATVAERGMQAFMSELLLSHLEARGMSREDISHLAIDASSIETPAAVGVDESVVEGDRRYTKDPEAGPGHMPAKNGRHSGSLIGYDLWAAVNTSGAGLDDVPSPGVVVGFGLAYPNKGGREVISLLERVKGLGTNPETVRADRGISNLVDDKKGGNFHVSLKKLGIELIHELGPTHTKPAPDLRGAVWVGSSLCCPCSPQGQAELPAHDRNMSQEERLELASRYDKRDRFHFQERQRSGVAGGGCRLQCPARAGKVRCPLVPKSMLRGMDEVPTIKPPSNIATPAQIARLARVDPEAAAKLEPAPDCCSQETITLPVTVEPGRYQRLHYGTTPWVLAYGQRQHVESSYAALKTNFASLRRGSYQQFGKGIPTFFIGLALLWVNYKTLRSFDYRYQIRT